MKNFQNSLHTFLKQKTDLEKIRDCFKLIAIKNISYFLLKLFLDTSVK